MTQILFNNISHLGKMLKCDLLQWTGSFKAMAFACKWGGKVNNWSYYSLPDLVEFCLNPPSSVCGAEMDKDFFTSFFASLLFGFWKYRNELVFRGYPVFKEAMTLLNRSVEEFTSGLTFSSTFRQSSLERWSPPRLGWWKVHSDASFANGRAVVIRDEFGFIVKAYSKLCMASSAFEVEAKTVEWAAVVAARED